MQKDETYWLIEHRNWPNPHWLRLDSQGVLDKHCWTDDAHCAFKFMSERDARDFVMCHYSGSYFVYLTEHRNISIERGQNAKG